MARFEDIPLKAVLDGTEHLAGGDPGTGADIGVTPVALTNYAQTHLPVAPASFPALISSTDWTKLNNLPTADALAALQARLAQQALGFFVAVPANGFVQFFSNPCTISFLLRGIRFATSSGTLTLQISINGTPITGFEAIAVTSTPTGLTSSGANILNPNDYVGFTISANAAGANLWFSLAATAILT